MTDISDTKSVINVAYEKMQKKKKKTNLADISARELHRYDG